MPRTTKQMESRMFDFPDPFRPVIALNFGSKRPITVRCAYDLKPSTMISMIRMVREGTRTKVHFNRLKNVNRY